VLREPGNPRASTDAVWEILRTVLRTAYEPKAGTAGQGPLCVRSGHPRAAASPQGPGASGGDQQDEYRHGDALTVGQRGRRIQGAYPVLRSHQGVRDARARRTRTNGCERVSPGGKTRRARTGVVPGEEHPTHPMSMPKTSSPPEAEIGHTPVQRRDATETIARGSLYATGAQACLCPAHRRSTPVPPRRFCAVGMGNLRL